MDEIVFCLGKTLNQVVENEMKWLCENQIFTCSVMIVMFWDIMLCSLVDKYQYLRETCCLQVQSRANSFSLSWPEARGSGFLQKAVT
jgi:hypothetical protein